MIIKAFTKHNPKFRAYGHSEEDSYKYSIENDNIVIAVADGVTRDPIGIKQFPENPNRETIKEIMKKYPTPSPAKIAADLFCESVIKKLKTPSVKSVKASIKYANKRIQLLNKKNNPCPDYLENDFWACVGVCGVVHKNFLYYGYICDCGLCVFSKDGKLKFITEDDGPSKRDSDIWNSSLLKGKKWYDSEARKIIRSCFRNNPQEKHSYGAFTGEETALHFIRINAIELEKNDFIFFFTDGMQPIVTFSTFNPKNIFGNLEEYAEKNSERIGGSEGTLVAIKS